MTEDSIKLFATRAERLPQPDDGQTLREAIEKAVEQVPVAGPITTFITSRFWAPSARRRLEEWLKGLADDFDRHCESCKIENLVKDEAFISASIQAARIVIGTHQRDKLEALKNAVLNVALRRSLDEEKQVVFLGLIENLTVTHLELLRLFNDRSVYPRDRMAQLRERRGLTDPMVIDLTARGLLSDPRPYIARTRESEESLVIQSWTLTPLGKEFLSFIASPDLLK